ncbi:MAG: hypothetical protein ACRDQA_16100 [Nocardioidaceae bacterium]
MTGDRVLCSHPDCPEQAVVTDEFYLRSSGGFVVQQLQRCTAGHVFDWIADEFLDPDMEAL